ncbi:hypothetical protein WMY93_000057 [Mugilogobius chulae]|uniref:MARVEL domain-containing protein n=1 Tax=Mugilogobius chulae TaxID=88201 RepID=A0AAW0QD71_9GOBI
MQRKGKERRGEAKDGKVRERERERESDRKVWSKSQTTPGILNHPGMFKQSRAVEREHIVLQTCGQSFFLKRSPPRHHHHADRPAVLASVLDPPVRMIFACVAFSVAVHEGRLFHATGDWCIFCWAFSFAGTLLVLLVELFGLQTRAPVSWKNFPITFACYATLLCLSASIIFPIYYLKTNSGPSKTRDYRIVSTVFSCLATIAYMSERSRFVRPRGCSSVLHVRLLHLLHSVGSYHHLLRFRVDWPPPIFVPALLSGYAMLAVLLYLSVTIIWPIFNFDPKHGGEKDRPSYCGSDYGICVWDKRMAVAVLTALNFILYLADMIYSTRLVFVSS